jgi:hypothetical protein
MSGEFNQDTLGQIVVLFHSIISVDLLTGNVTPSDLDGSNCT